MNPNDALLTLIAEMRMNMANADAERDKALTELAEARERIAELESQADRTTPIRRETNG